MQKMDPPALLKVAEYFRALAEPMRLRLLSELRTGEKSVGQLADLVQGSQANVSKHLSVLLDAGILQREQRGTSSIYWIADPATLALCDLVCGNVAAIIKQQPRIKIRAPAAQRRLRGT